MARGHINLSLAAAVASLGIGPFLGVAGKSREARPPKTLRLKRVTYRKGRVQEPSINRQGRRQFWLKGVRP